MHRNLLYFFASIFTLIYLLAPKTVVAFDPLGTWFSTLSLPYNLASHVSFSHENVISVLGGSANTGQSKFNVLTATPLANGSVDTWTTTSLTPTALIFHSSVKQGNHIYIIGGREENPGSALGYVQKVFVGELNDEGLVTSWAELSSLPQARGQGGAVIIGNRIYYAGGFTGGGADDDIYHANINPDGTLAPWEISDISLPEPLRGFGMVAHEDNIIVFGGRDGNSYNNQAYVAQVNPDGSLNSFVETESLPENVYRSAFIKIDSTLISVGGYNGTSYITNVYYTEINNDGTLGSWETSSNNSPNISTGASLTESNGYLYLTGGYSDPSGYSNSTFYTKLELDNPTPPGIPFFSQTDPLWADQTYDNTTSTINELGCALTSAAMVMKYHGIDLLPDATPLTPGSLNAWLNDNGDNWWRQGLVSWASIQRLTKLINEVYPDSPILDYRKIKGSDWTTIDDILTTNQHPLIFEEPRPDSPSLVHFPLGYEVVSSTMDYKILDPFYSTRTNLTLPPDQIASARYLYPTNTDLSSIVIHADQDLNFAITNPNSLRTGSRGGDSREDIPNSTVDLSNPIYNPIDPESILGEPFWETLISDPMSGQYTLQFSSRQTGSYNIEIYAYDQDAILQKFGEEIFLIKNQPSKFKLDYFKEGGEDFAVLNPTNSVIRNAIWGFYESEDITNKGVAHLLANLIWLAEKFEGTALEDNFINQFITQLNRFQPRFINDTAYDYLSAAVNSL